MITVRFDYDCSHSHTEYLLSWGLNILLPSGLKLSIESKKYSKFSLQHFLEGMVPLLGIIRKMEG